MRTAQESQPTTRAGGYVHLRETPDGNLDIVLSEHGRQQFPAIESFRRQYGTRLTLRAILSDHLQSGWELVTGKDLGLPTSAPMLSRDIHRDNAGRIIFTGRVYWYDDYAFLDEIEELRRNGFLEFRGAP